MYVLTEAINQYDQEGDYLVAVFANKPTFDDLANGELFHKESADLINHILTGGGRIAFENTWYHLSELKEGQIYRSFQDGQAPRL